MAAWIRLICHRIIPQNRIDRGRLAAGSVSFGHSREFVLRNNHDRSRRYTISLGSEGDTLFMSGNCQRDWQHSIPKRANANQARVNLTFRKIIDKELTAAV